MQAQRERLRAQRERLRAQRERLRAQRERLRAQPGRDEVGRTYLVERPHRPLTPAAPSAA
ncbi:hypothetical protein [Ottowia oryzae]